MIFVHFSYSMTRIFALLAVCVAMVAAYPGGPPIGDSNPTLCSDMVPTGHGVSAQTVDAPYVYVLSTNNCYKAGLEIKGNKMACYLHDCVCRSAGFLYDCR